MDLGEFVDVIDDLVIFIDRAKAVGLPARTFAARTAHRRFQGIVGIGIGLGEIEFEFRRYDQYPALPVIKLQNVLEHIARCNLHGTTVLPSRIVNDLRRGT